MIVGDEANRSNCGQETSTTATRRVRGRGDPDRSGPDLYRAMRGYPRMGSGDRCGLQLPDPGFALSRIRSTAVCYRSRNWECLEICAERWKTVVDLWPGDRVLNLNMEVPRSGVRGTQPRYRM